MYLKNLTALGFKSFADKMSLNFQPGVAAIVGPNGCGKSNVSDAIRWVLGEQSAKVLRGGEMADVIFNGTDSRKPMGMAEVSLTLGDVDTDQLRAAGITVEFNEVTITRRVFRDGGSEYFINKVGCRLRDIQQLFMGTGMGKASYSIMAQGNITQILSSRPEDRRLVFEEAAGITKFKSQRKEALRKLESTEQNLLRVQDLIKEVKRQIGSLQRQAGKARRFKSLQAELQSLETQLARHQFDVLQQEIAARQEELLVVSRDMEASQESVLKTEDEILQLRTRLGELEQEISLNQQHGLELKANSDRHGAKIGFNEQRIQELESQNERALQDIRQSEERCAIAQEELVAVTERLEASQVSLNALRSGLEERRIALQVVEREVSAGQESLRVAQSQAFAAAQGLARTRNELNQLDLQKQGNVVRLEKLAAERVGLEEERNRLEARLTEFSMQVESERLSVQASRGTLEERQQRVRELQGEIATAQQQLDGVVRQQAEKRSRLNVLEQLDTQHEGFAAGALAALRQSDAVLGSLADKIRVPGDLVPAIEAALGHHLQLVLTQNSESATRILSDLSAGGKGRASLAALSLAPANSEVSAASEGLPGLRALDGVECEESVKPLIEGLLGRTRIVADLAEATVAWTACGGALDFVTRNGEVLTRLGIYTGGAVGNSAKAPASILGRKNQIAELQSELQRLGDQVQEASRAKAALQAEQTALQASLEEARSELRQQEVAIATRQGEFNALKNSQRSLAAKFDTVVHDLETLSSVDQEGVARREKLVAQVADLESIEQNASLDVARLSADLEEHRQRRDGAQQGVSDAKVSLATEEQLHASHGRQRAPLEQRIRETTALVQRLESELGGFAGRREQYSREIEESRHQIERLDHERRSVAEQVAGLVQQKSGLETEISTREEGLRDQRIRLAASQARRGTLEVELAQKTMATENLREKIRTKYQVELDTIRGEGIRITLADEGPAKVETVSLEEMQAAGLSTDWDAVTAQVAAIQKRVDDIGPVNLVAIEEYDETEQRYNFLNTQNEDLVKAKEQLLEVINRINAETKTMFVETFTRIRDNFRVLFSEIFGGGKADLELVEGEDVLESGINIVARPPGKQLQSISLLSGGEQTMTAVALLFAIYQVKPSPFCVLDELDAPLDESNINRFIKVLQRFIDHSQFIVITHNKRTIGMADVLYGVTMQEQGVSKIVSVRFNRDEPAGDRAPALVTVEPQGLGGTPGEHDVVMAK